ncbi:MAG: ShlB/FhaC/HecB family hemolysin secretion/activation protein [Cyanobacteria bacterium J06597_1]
MAQVSLPDSSPLPSVSEPRSGSPPEGVSDDVPAAPATIVVERFEFDGNTAFSDRQLAAAAERYTGRPLTFVELLEVETVVEEVYSQDGFISSGAVIEANQALSPINAVVTVRVIEGELDAIEISGTRRLRNSYIRSRLEIATTGALNQENILEALQLLQLDPLIKSVSADLSAGARANSGVLSVAVEEANPYRLEIFTNNGRVPTVGTIRRGITLGHRNLLGFGDELTGTYTNTNGSNSGDFSYSIPFNGQDGTFELAGGLTDTEVVEDPFDRIDLTGESFYWSAGFRQPVVRSPNREVAVGLALTGQSSQTKILGQGVRLSEGADLDGRVRITALRLSQDWTERSVNDVLAARSQVSIGLDAFGATDNSNAPDSSFVVWQGQVQYVRKLPADILFSTRSNVQLADRPLLIQEQFNLGGLNSVRGYRQDSLLTDSGWFISAETAFPIFRISSVDGIFQLIPFIDYGVGWEVGSRDEPGASDLLGVGIGAQWQMSDTFSARLDWGIPLIDREDRDRTLQEQGIYFSVKFSPF